MNLSLKVFADNLIESAQQFNTFNEIESSLQNSNNEVNFQQKTKHYTVSVVDNKYQLKHENRLIKQSGSYEELIKFILEGEKAINKTWINILEYEDLHKELLRLGDAYAAITQKVPDDETIVYESSEGYYFELFDIEKEAIALIICFALNNKNPEWIGDFNLKDILYNQVRQHFAFDDMIDVLIKFEHKKLNEYKHLLLGFADMASCFFYHKNYKRIYTAYRPCDFHQFVSFLNYFV